MAAEQRNPFEILDELIENLDLTLGHYLSTTDAQHFDSFSSYVREKRDAHAMMEFNPYYYFKFLHAFAAQHKTVVLLCIYEKWNDMPYVFAYLCSPQYQKVFMFEKKDDVLNEIEQAEVISVLLDAKNKLSN